MGRRRRRSARVTVADNGVGIDEAELGSIFQVFASTKGSRGTGLGLPVSQKIVREHGGKIAVTSQLGQGATFVIELPMTPQVRPRGDGRGADDDGLKGAGRKANVRRTMGPLRHTFFPRNSVNVIEVASFNSTSMQLGGSISGDRFCEML